MLSNGKDAVKAFKKIGFEVIRQRGSHITMGRGSSRVLILDHAELSVGARSRLMKRLRLETDKNGDRSCKE